jgi:uncharacterized protein YndB with AHSA1/START domain
MIGVARGDATTDARCTSTERRELVYRAFTDPDHLAA